MAPEACGPRRGAMASDVDYGHAVEGEGPGTAVARWTGTLTADPLTGADGQPVLLDDLPVHAGVRDVAQAVARGL